jgi:LysM repeat protein
MSKGNDELENQNKIDKEFEDSVFSDGVNDFDPEVVTTSSVEDEFDWEEADEQVIKTRNTLYEMQLNDELAKDKKIYVQRLNQKMKEGRDLYIAGDIQEGTRKFNEIGSDSEKYPDPTYTFEADLKNAYYDGVAARRKIEAEHTKNELVSAYTLKNDKENKSYQVNAYRALKDKSENPNFNKFALRFLAINSLAKQTTEPALKKVFFQQIGDSSFDKFSQNENNKDLVKNILKEVDNHIDLQGLEINEETRQEQILVLLSKDLDTSKKLNNMEIAFNQIYLKDLQVEPEINLQQQKVNEIKSSVSDAVVYEYADFGTKGIAQQVSDQGHNYGDIDFTYHDKTVNKIKNEFIFFVKPTSEIERINYQEEVKAEFEAFEESDALVQLTDPEKLNYKSKEDMQQFNTKDGKVLNLYFQPRNVAGETRTVYFEDSENPITDIKPEPTIEAPQAVNKEEKAINAVAQSANDELYDVDVLRQSTLYLKRQMMLSQAIPKSKEDYDTKLKAINKSNQSYEDKQEDILTLKNTTFKIEKDLMDQYLIEKNEQKVLKNKVDKSKEDIKRLDALNFWVEQGAEQYIAQKFILDDKTAKLMEDTYPEIKENVEERIRNARDPKIVNPQQKYIEATIIAFSSQHNIESDSIKKIFQDASKEDVKKAVGVALKGTLLAMNPAGFIISKGIKGILSHDNFKKFRSDFGNRLADGFEHIGIKKGTKKAAVTKFIGVFLLGATAATYAIASGNIDEFPTAEELKELKDKYLPEVENIVDKDIAELEIKHGSFSEGLDKFKSLSEQQLSSLKSDTALVEPVNLDDLTWKEELEIAMKANPESMDFNSKIQQIYNESLANQPEIKTPEIVPDSIIGSDMYIATYDNDLLVSNIMNNELQIDKLREGVALIENKGLEINIEDTLKSIEDNIHKQLADGTFPRDIKIDFTQVDGDFTISKEQLLAQQNILETPLYTVAKGDTLSEIAEAMAKQEYGADITDDKIWEITDKIKVLNNLESHHLINTDQVLKLPNLEVLNQYAATDPNPEFQTFNDIKNGTTKFVLLPETNISEMSAKIAKSAVLDGTIGADQQIAMQKHLVKHMQDTPNFSDLQLDTQTDKMISEIKMNERVEIAKAEAEQAIADQKIAASQLEAEQAKAAKRMKLGNSNKFA